MSKRHFLIGTLLAALTVAAYGRVGGHQFLLGFDDGFYLTSNGHVPNGLTWENVGWAFTTGFAYNWLPITWLSHMLDVELFGMRPGFHHAVNLAWHVVNVVALFWVLARMTQALWPSAFVAALFALHPLHVESVAWIAERKDVLSTFFWLMALAAYVRYVRDRKAVWYLAMLILFALGLMSKAMLVTFPATLLLLDSWPLGRFGPVAAEAPEKRCGFGRLVWEKVPLFVLAGLCAGVAYFVQQTAGAVQSFARVGMKLRLANAVAAYGIYLAKMVWPSRLAAYYPHRVDQLPWWHVGLALVVLLAITALAVLRARRNPYLLVGWLWYLGTLLPVIGLIQIGGQAMANRYTYVPLIGVFIMVAWGVPALLPPDKRRRILAPVAAAVLAALAASTCVHAGHWRDMGTLFAYTLSVSTDNALAHNNLGGALIQENRWAEAEAHFKEACRISPEYDRARWNLALAFEAQNKLDEGAEYFEKVLKLQPGRVALLNTLGSALEARDECQRAAEYYEQALCVDPNHIATYLNFGAMLIRLERYGEAVACFGKAVSLAPKNPLLIYNLGIALEKRGDRAEALDQYERVLRLVPGFTLAEQRVRQLKESRR